MPHPALPAQLRADQGCPTSQRVTVHDDLDLAAVGAVSLDVVVALEHGARTVVLDMTSCAFVDLVGHQLLRGLREQARSAGADLVLQGVSARVTRLLELLDEIIDGDAVAPSHGVLRDGPRRADMNGRPDSDVHALRPASRPLLRVVPGARRTQPAYRPMSQGEQGR